MGKRKYQLPHYDRIHPMTRNAMDIAMIAGEIEEIARQVGAENPEDVIWMLENGGYELFFNTSDGLYRNVTGAGREGSGFDARRCQFYQHRFDPVRSRK